jgi:hypothetical protein
MFLFICISALLLFLVLLGLVTMANKSVLKWFISIIIIWLLFCNLYDFLNNIYIIYFNTEIAGNNIGLDAVLTSKYARARELEEKFRSQYLEHEYAYVKSKVEAYIKATVIGLLCLSFMFIGHATLFFISCLSRFVHCF